MVLGAAYIVAFTLLAAGGWHFIYKWFVSEGASSYEALMLTSVFQSMVCAVSFLVDVKNRGLSTDIQDNNRIEDIYMLCAAGFFFHDTPHWQDRHTLTSYTLLLHHVVAFIFILATLFYGKGGLVALQVSFYMEVTTPLLAIRHYLRKIKVHAGFVENLFAVLFVSLRFWVGADVMLSVLQNDEVPTPFKVGIIIIYFMSCGLLPGVLQMITTTYRPVGKAKSQRQSRVMNHHFATSLYTPSTTTTRSTRSSRRLSERSMKTNEFY